MKLHQEFSLNPNAIKPLGRELFVTPPHLIEELITSMTKKGYRVLKSSIYFMGIPQSITVVKEFSGPFVSHFANKIRDDFEAVSRKLGIKELFE